MGISWISRKEGILENGGGVGLEKGGMTPLNNYGINSLLNPLLNYWLYKVHLNLKLQEKHPKIVLIEICPNFY